LTRRYLDRKTKEHFKKLVRYDDEPKHITEIGPKIPEFDEAIKAPRALHLADVEDVQFDPDDILTIKIMELVNAAKETKEYIEQTNEHLDEQTKHLDELKNAHRAFEKEIKSLKTKTEPEG
jgi:chromosome segregation ATPase